MTRPRTQQATARPAVHTGAVEIAIGGDVIRLGQLLKFANVVSDGGQAKALLANGAVRVDGVVELRRGRKLRAGARVQMDGCSLLLEADPQ